MTKIEPSSMAEICSIVKSYYPEADVEILQKAHDFAERVHGDQKRHSGEPYMMHPRDVCKILAELRLDVPTLMTGLLHDTVEDTDITLDDIKREFGEEITRMPGSSNGRVGSRGSGAITSTPSAAARMRIPSGRKRSPTSTLVPPSALSNSPAPTTPDSPTTRRSRT